jgi:transposase InsO family protein
VKYLGFLIGKNGLRPVPEKVKPVNEFPVPTTLAEVRRFLGMMNRYRDWIPHLATVLEPLQGLLRKNAVFKWTHKCKVAFEKAKQKLCKACCNAIFDPSAATIVTTDASGTGLGAVLSQIQNGKEVPIEFASYTLLEHERAYPANELESYGCVWACEHWEKYLLGIHFTLRTDHQALTSTLKVHGKKIAKHRRYKFQRWHDRLALFSYDVEYRKGSLNDVADALSRCSPSSTDPVNIGGITSGITFDALRKITADDKVSQEVMQYVRCGSWPVFKKVQPHVVPYFHVRKELRVKDQLLYRNDRIVLPASIVDEILSMAHKGHPGIVRMKRKIRETYWWPGFNRSIESKVKYCGECQASSKSVPPEPVLDTHLPNPKDPWQMISMDIVGPFANIPEHQKFLLSLVDHFSGYPEVKPTGKITSHVIITWLKELFARYGAPASLLSDNGPQFVSEEFDAFLESKGTQHPKSAVYNPQSNGKVEVFNRYLKHGIEAKSENQSLQDCLSDLLGSFRATAPTASSDSPAKLFFKREIRLPFQPAIPMPMESQPPQIQDQNPPTATNTKFLKNRGPYKVSDKVLVRRPQVLKGQSPWSKPLTVVQVLGNYTYLLDDNQVWNARKMRRFFPPEEAPVYLDEVGGVAEEPNLRRSTRTTKGRPPTRFEAGGELFPEGE